MDELSDCVCTVSTNFLHFLREHITDPIAKKNMNEVIGEKFFLHIAEDIVHFTVNATPLKFSTKYSIWLKHSTVSEMFGLVELSQFANEILIILILGK